MTDSEKTDILETCLAAAGVPLWGLLGEAGLQGLCSGLAPETRLRYGLDAARGAVAAALPYSELEAESPAWAAAWTGPRARLARFARANWYAELVARLREAGTRAARLIGPEPGPARGGWRSLANSGLPERELALASGLGRRGRNGLVMVEGAGAACVLGLLLLPFSPRVGPLAWDWSALAPACSSCRRCVEACPTGALEGGFERARCLQHWSAIDAELPPAIEAAWGSRLYGCDSCLEACPRFRPEPRARTGLGVLGPGLPAAWFAATGEAEIRAALKGSALGLGWMSMAAFRRNAELAAKVV